MGDFFLYSRLALKILPLKKISCLNMKTTNAHHQFDSLLIGHPSVNSGTKIPPNVRYDHEDKAQNIKHNNITFIMMSTYTYKFIRSFNLAKEKDMSIVEVATAYLSIFDEHEGRRSTT